MRDEGMCVMGEVRMGQCIVQRQFAADVLSCCCLRGSRHQQLHRGQVASLCRMVQWGGAAGVSCVRCRAFCQQLPNHFGMPFHTGIGERSTAAEACGIHSGPCCQQLSCHLDGNSWIRMLDSQMQGRNALAAAPRIHCSASGKELARPLHFAHRCCDVQGHPSAISHCHSTALLGLRRSNRRGGGL